MGQPKPYRDELADRPRRCEHRGPEDDFFCIRYQVWYPSFDCALRTAYRTAPGCRDCEQGLFNHKRHGEALKWSRFRTPVAAD